MPADRIVQSIDEAGDSIGLDSSAHFELCWRELVQSPDTFQDERYYRLITGEDHPLGNFAIISDASNVSAAVEAASPLLDIGAPAAVFSCAEVSDVMSDRLNAMGFSVVDTMPAMAIDIAGISPTQLPTGYEAARVTSGEEASAWINVLAEGYPLPFSLARKFSPEVCEASSGVDASAQWFAIRREGKVVATSMLYLAGGLAGVYCVATLPEERGRGLGAHVTAEALKAGQQAGYKVGVLQSSEAGHSVYLALGFCDVGNVYAFMQLPETDSPETNV